MLVHVGPENEQPDYLSLYWSLLSLCLCVKLTFVLILALPIQP